MSHVAIHAIQHIFEPSECHVLGVRQHSDHNLHLWLPCATLVTTDSASAEPSAESASAEPASTEPAARNSSQRATKLSAAQSSPRPSAVQ